jgi:2'-hydroxyisoflavone reductase
VTRTLILGGTVFLGRHVATEALARGHELTLFTRGRHGTIDGAEHLIGDRAGDLSALEHREWDVVIDTSGYQAEHVARSSAALASSGAHLVFVSSINAYPAWPEQAVEEDSPVWLEGDDYGPQKAASERAAAATMPTAAVRAGLICGPHDNVFRLPWWVRRIAQGGRVPAPGDPSRTVQLIDARDLAAWMLDLGERRVTGAFNGTSPAGRTTMREVLEAAGSEAELVWIPDDRLLEAGVEPWTELPLWLPAAGTWEVGTERAQAAGLRCRPIAETIGDVRAWLRDRGEEELDDWRSEHRPRPMTPEREAELLALH